MNGRGYYGGSIFVQFTDGITDEYLLRPEDWQDIINFADEINNAPASDEGFDNINNLSNVFREDEVIPSYPATEILKNAPEQAEDHFLVRNRE